VSESTEWWAGLVGNVTDFEVKRIPIDIQVGIGSRRLATKSVKAAIDINELLHGLDAPQIDPGNALRFKLSEIGERDRVDVILTNPVWSKYPSGAFRPLNGNIEPMIDEIGLLFSGGLSRVAGA
jgi:hypothetical protein